MSAVKSREVWSAVRNDSRSVRDRRMMALTPGLSLCSATRVTGALATSDKSPIVIAMYSASFS